MTDYIIALYLNIIIKYTTEKKLLLIKNTSSVMQYARRL
jgi:hypothetical protein